MLKRVIYLKIILSILALGSMAAGYERVPEDKGVVYKGLLPTVWSWVSSAEPPIVPPVFKPITRELTKEEKEVALKWLDTGLLYLRGTDEAYPKNIQRGLDLENAAAECGQRNACNNLAYSYRKGRNGLPIDLDIADAYERHGKWSSADDERLAQAPAAAAPVAAPAATSEDAAGRRSSGGSDSSTSASDTSGEAASGLRHRVAVRAKP